MSRTIQGTLFASAARTATPTPAPAVNNNCKGVRISIDTTVVPGSAPSTTPSVEVQDPIAGTWNSILTGAAITAVGHVELVIYPGAIAVANRVLNEPLPKNFRLVMTHGNANSMTYSAGYVLIP